MNTRLLNLTGGCIDIERALAYAYKQSHFVK